jgi:hypothetical protein
MMVEGVEEANAERHSSLLGGFKHSSQSLAIASFRPESSRWLARPMIAGPSSKMHQTGLCTGQSIL